MSKAAVAKAVAAAVVLSLPLVLLVTLQSSAVGIEPVSVERQEAQVSSRKLFQEERLTLSREVEKACSSLGSEHEFAAVEESISRFAIALFLFLLLLTFLFAYMLHMTHFTYVHEAGAALLMGVLCGFVISRVNTCSGKVLKEVVKFNKEIFFLLLLPPIIFEAGYNMKRLHFFKNIGPIIAYAFAGTAISTIVIALLCYMVGLTGYGFAYSPVESLIFGALISATDPVTVLAIFSEMKADLNLYSMVFGESVLNDAVAIVLYKTIDRFNPRVCEPNCDVTFLAFLGAIWFFLKVFVGSILIGAFVGMSSSIIYKHAHLKDQDIEHLESAMTATFPYMAWMIAEGCGLSGIISILACGICMAHYTYNNMSDRTQIFTRKFYKMVAMLAETFVFIYMGMAMFSIEQSFQASAIIIAIFIVLFSRTFNIYPLTALINLGRTPDTKIDMRFQFVMWFSGLRGAIAFALALEANIGYAETGAGPMMLTTTLFVVLFTVLSIGGLCATVLNGLKLKQPPKQEDETVETVKIAKSATGFLSFDRRYIKPMLTNRPKPVATENTGGAGDVEMDQAHLTSHASTAGHDASMI